MLMIHDFVYKISISMIAPFILKFSVWFVSNIHRLGLQSRRATKLESKIKTANDFTLMKECNSDTIENHGIYRDNPIGKV